MPQCQRPSPAMLTDSAGAFHTRFIRLNLQTLYYDAQVFILKVHCPSGDYCCLDSYYCAEEERLYCPFWDHCWHARIILCVLIMVQRLYRDSSSPLMGLLLSLLCLYLIGDLYCECGGSLRRGAIKSGGNSLHSMLNPWSAGKTRSRFLSMGLFVKARFACHLLCWC